MKNSAFRYAACAGIAVALLTLAGCGDDDAASSAATTSSASSGAGGGVGGDINVGGYGGMGAGGYGGGGAAVPVDGFGEISGMCGEIDPRELAAGSPAFVVNNELDFGLLMFDENQLSPGGLQLFNDPNLGGSSKYSEIFAYEMLYRCEFASLLKTEGEIVYDIEGKKTDFLTEIDGLKVGVSVTRAYKYMAPFEQADALVLLNGKLADILLSTQNVAPGDAWGKQILHIMAYAESHVAALAAAYPTVDESLRADTIVVVTLTSGDDEFVYTSN